MLVILTFGVLQVPKVQTKLAQEAAKLLTNATGYKFQLEKVAIYWFDLASIKNIKIFDRQGELMIASDEVEIDFSINDLTGDPILIDEAFIYSPNVYLIRNTEDKTLNLDEFIITMRKTFIGKKKPGKKRKVKAFVINEGHLVGGYFSYDDRTKGYNQKPEVFDKFHFSFKEINADISRFYTHLDTFSLGIRELSTIEEKTTLLFDSLCADMRLTRHSLSFENLISDVNTSKLNGNLRFEYDSIKHMSQFVDSINIVADLKQCLINTQDLAHFSPELKPFHDKWKITSDFNGRIRNFDLENMTFSFGESSYFKGHVGFKGLPQIYETLIDIDLNESRVIPKDIKQYVGNKYYGEVEKFGTVSFYGDFFGFPNNFVAHGNASSALGNFYSDLKFVIDEQKESSYYTGHLKTDDFMLGKFLNRTDVGKISMKGKVTGEGFDIENAKMRIKAQASKFEYNDYAYKNIDIDALLEQGLFDGLMIIEDPNLNLSANGKIDFRDQKDIFDIYVSLEKANLQEINLTKDSAFFSGEMDLRFKGLSMDEIQGVTTLKNMKIYYNEQKLDIDNFYFLSTKKDSTRKFLVKSSYFDINIEGEYNFGAIYNHLLVLKDELILLIENEPEATASYYEQKSAAPSFFADYELTLHDINPLLKLYNADMMIAPNTKVKGDILSGKTSIFNMQTKVDSLTYEDFSFKDNIIDISIAKKSDSSSTLGMIYLNSQQQSFSKTPILKDLRFETLIDKEDIGFSLKTKDYDSNDFGKFSGNIALKKNATKICLNPSKLRVYGNTWQSKDSTFITIVNKSIQFDSLNFQSDSQKVLMHGMLAQSALTPL